ncbi:MAG: bifunctional riboflavin kinase/FAD synthetase [Candidatus Omnitrophota bacterium]|jgi:riboflavin kinase/FMN adenylyltransferase
MKIIYGINKVGRFRKPVVALGVFDGVHIGHRHILKSAVAKAKNIGGTSMVVTFWPDPHKEQSIYSLEHRLRLIGDIGIDICVVIRFNQRFSGIPAGNFIKNILVEKIGVKYIYIGNNYRFGKDGRGDLKSLRKLSSLYGFSVKPFDILKINSKAVSSTYIRKLITRGKLKEAERLLSRPVSVLGTVIKGASLGRKLGFPTANIDPHHEVLPPSGIYATLAIKNNKKLKGACYIGTRPTFVKQKEKQVELFIFDFKKDIYGEYLEIQFVKKIRDDRKFASTDLLVRQIKKDIFYARRVFSLPS